MIRTMIDGFSPASAVSSASRPVHTLSRKVEREEFASEIMSDEIATLLTSQSDLHGRMARSVTNLRKLGTANITLRAVEARLALLDQMWTEFEKQHKLIQVHYKDAFDQSEYNTSQFIDSAENTYVLQRGLLSEYLAKLKAENSSTAPPSARTDCSTKSALPRLKIRSFSGAFEDWPSFRDIFLSVVGNNPQT
ncbi:PREDICTED: uncharacterized protein LOC105145867 [Acromyrmex echinatior]|uniref:uncharacterized protein LOC105145867 n=1 Tax=Acromyrmex echinatior TaxID=103372 RepID=UPI000580CB2B|nr:PREDICTED: uncharacterized protein LOC105145867 [Acromyrmex echinatior]XP_011054068.1 PREDICTED: uncharacterized protein LOC105145867 [Acromyrmex echinatior]